MFMFFMAAPIIVSVAVLLYALKNGFNKVALYISAAVSMVIAMFIMRNSCTWYALVTALTVPLALCYVLICLGITLLESRRIKDK